MARLHPLIGGRPVFAAGVNRRKIDKTEGATPHENGPTPSATDRHFRKGGRNPSVKVGGNGAQ